MEQIGISIKQRGSVRLSPHEVIMFDADKIKNPRIKSGCGCVMFDYKSVTYKPTVSLKKLKEIINAGITV